MKRRLKKRVNFTIPESLHEKAKAQAAARGVFDGNLSAYIRDLIDRDLAQAKDSAVRSQRR